MGKKTGAKGKKKKGKGPEKPDTMSDEDWALYNNFENLLQNLRGNCVFNTIFCTVSRATAALWLWQHAAASRATRQKLVDIMIVPQAVAAFKQVEPHEKPACVGLIHCLSEIDGARLQLIDTKPVPPHPGINCVLLLFDSLVNDRNSMSAEVAVLGTLRNLCEDLEARKVVSKYLRAEGHTKKHDKLLVLIESFKSPSAQARADAALILRFCMMKSSDDMQQNTAAEEMVVLLIKYNLISTLLAVLEKGCSDCSQGGAVHGPSTLVNISQCLLKLAPYEEAKDAIVKNDGIRVCIMMMEHDTHPVRERGGQAVAILLEAKAACANVMQWVTLPRNYNIHEYRLLLGQRLNHVLPFTLAGLEGRLEGVDQSAIMHAATEADLVTPGSPPLKSEPAERATTAPASSTRPMSILDQLKDLKLREHGPNLPEQELPMILDRLKMVVDQGGVAPLVKLLIPPGGLQPPPDPNAKKGKKGKGKKGKGKEPPLPPGKAEAYTGACGTLRHISLLDEARDQIRDNQGVLAASALLNSKVSETRAHATGMLLSLGQDVPSEPLMESSRVPEYIQHLSSPGRRSGRDYQMSKFARAQPDPSMRPVTAP
mmetsp:Transcript_28998/g.55588  ORF Transcript_28998/g.55588 Transcript_28998/m.55588 type:complete len:598 (-) Transcript_28998:580-2373(-)